MVDLHHIPMASLQDTKLRAMATATETDMRLVMFTVTVTAMEMEKEVGKNRRWHLQTFLNLLKQYQLPKVKTV